MENYKVRVSNEAESKEVQGLFFELGYVWRGLGDKSDSLFFPINLTNYQIIAYKETMDMQITGGDFKGAKEIKIQQLRNLVAAKTKKVPYLVKTIDKWEEQELTSDTPESETCLKIPDGAEALLELKDGNLVFYSWHTNGHCFVNDHRCNFLDFSKSIKEILWVKHNNVVGLRDIKPTQPEELPFTDDEPKRDDNVNHPLHYTQSSIECIEALEAATVNKQGIEAVCVANVIKYLWRYESKNGLEDVKKAQWYLQKLVDKLEQNNG